MNKSTERKKIPEKKRVGQKSSTFNTTIKKDPDARYVEGPGGQLIDTWTKGEDSDLSKWEDRH